MLSAVIVTGGSAIILEIGRAVEQPHTPVRKSRFKRAQVRRQWGEREVAPEGVPAVSC